MNKTNAKERVKQFIEEFQKEELVKKYLYEGTWTSGSSTTVYPIAICVNSWKSEIVVQWNSDKRIFDKFINRTVEKHKDILARGHFWKSDGSCPSTITFRLKETFS